MAYTRIMLLFSKLRSTYPTGDTRRERILSTTLIFAMLLNAPLAPLVAQLLPTSDSISDFLVFAPFSYFHNWTGV